jgi:D-glycero-D-manno-heptose 1,7-bisphosphate phosphatase
MTKAIFFDRDGVLNYTVKREHGETAPWTLKEFKMVVGSIEAIQKAKDMGYMALVVTNQPDVKYNKMKMEELDKIHRSLMGWLHVDEIMYASDRGSDMYKPNNGMVEHFIKKYDLNREECFMIGDRWKDIVCGNKSNIKTIYIGQEYTSFCPAEYLHILPDYTEMDVLSAVNRIGVLNDQVVQ